MLKTRLWEGCRGAAKVLTAMAGVCLLALGAQTTAMAYTINVTVQGAGASGNPSGFRWLVEEDNTTQSVPGVSVNNSIGTVIHKSHAPVVVSGHSATNTATITVPDGKWYFVSVLPDAGFAIGGTSTLVNPLLPFTFPSGAVNLKIIVTPEPIPTAQIWVLAHVDHNAINNVPDQGEPGLGGFSVIIHDDAGMVSQDAFGNPLGTQYDDSIPPNVTVMGAPGGLIKTMSEADVGNPTLNPYSLAVGEALIKHLPPGKYGCQMIPPTGTPWIQTATIEGSQVVDAWVKAGEPRAFTEGFGTGVWHAFFGFVNPTATNYTTSTDTRLPWLVTPPAGTGSITGTLRFNHFGAPPNNQVSFGGAAVSEAWVGLNDPVTGQGLYAAAANQNTAQFSIANVPPGTYQLVWWDKPLDALFGFQTVTVPPGAGSGGPVALGNVLAFRWFGTHEGFVFWDDGGPTHIPSHVGNGFMDPEEVGIENEILNLRYRDGRIYQSTSTDPAGEYSFGQVFPFFKWLVAELDYTRYKPTGMTAVADAGGVFGAHNGWAYPSFDRLTPQPQTSPNSWVDGTTPSLTPLNNYWTGNNYSRTENSLPTSTPGGTGATFPFLVQAIQNYLNQTTYIDWGKTLYGPGENGGISGMVYYVVTAAEDDPRLAAGEPWEPGIPRAVLNLYKDTNNDGVIDDVNGSGLVEMSDVDNTPFGWSDGSGPKGPEDVDHNADGVFDTGDAVQTASTDSWDDSPPTDCHQILPDLAGGPPAPCFDNYGTWNQVRDGVFDGGYAFTSYFPDGISGATPERSLDRGYYIVEGATPPGYLLLKEENKNVDFGDGYEPGPDVIPPVCVGTADNLGPTPPDGAPRVAAGGSSFVVPAELTLFPGVPAPFAGQVRPFCSLRKVRVSDGFNAAANFWALTEVPKASRCVGFVNNDLSAEFNAGSPIFGEKASPAWIPCSFKDWNGNEIVRVYSDEYGSYNALLPSSFTKNVVTPTGVAPNLITVCLNDPMMPSVPGDPTSPRIPDPRYDPNYGQVCWTLHYNPGATTYLDTPIVPLGAFVGYPYTAVDIEPASGTPEIASVDGPTGGPVVCNSPSNGDTITIVSMGTVAVTNPAYNPTLPGPPANPWNVPTVTRDYGFGPYVAGMSLVTVNGVPLTINPVNWSNAAITATVPAGVTTGTLVVTRADTQRTSTNGVTLHVLTPAQCATGVRRVTAAPYPATPIQDAIDVANSCDLILVAPGTYDENPIVYKPLKLQGAGASTVINAQPGNTLRLNNWHTKIRTLFGTPTTDPYVANEAPGFMVLGTVLPGYGGIPFPATPNTCALIDGFFIQGSQAGGGIYVDNQVHYLQISGNKVKANQGSYGGGITVGTPDITSSNTYITIKDNEVVKNGGISGGGGVTLYEGSDHYTVTRNLISANLTRQNGGGILHEGLSDHGLIERNKILFNEVFFGGQLGGDGGGIFLGSGAVAGALGDGAGNVDIVGNLIQGNLAGSGFGGGIRAWGYNGTDVSAGGPDTYELNIFNNMIVNNVAANAGGGVSLQDTARVNIINTTIADNDSTATAISTFAAGSANSTPQGAGLVGGYHSLVLRTALAAAGDPQTFANPRLEDSIIWHNQSFYYDPTLNATKGGLVPNPAFPPNGYWDLTVAGTPAPQILNPQYCDLSSTAGYAATNVSTDPLFVREYDNALVSAKVTDEGGNNISVRYSPIDYSAGDYHLSTTSSGAFNLGRSTAFGTYPALTLDFDRQGRPQLVYPDAGADELIPAYIPFVLDPIQNLVVGSGQPGPNFLGPTQFSWEAPAGVAPECLPLQYDLLRSTVASDFMSATCVAPNLTVTEAADSTVPGSGEVFYYLVRDKSALCGENLGTRSDGTPRTGGVCHE